MKRWERHQSRPAASDGDWVVAVHSSAALGFKSQLWATPTSCVSRWTFVLATFSSSSAFDHIPMSEFNAAPVRCWLS